MRKAEQQHRPYPPTYMAAVELAFWLNCSERTVEEYSKVKLLPPPVRIGNLTRWRWLDVERHIAENNGEFPALAEVAADEYAANIIKLKGAAKRIAQEAGDDSAS